MDYQEPKTRDFGVNLCEGCLEKQREIDRLKEENQQKLNQNQRKLKEGFFNSSTSSAKLPVKANSLAENQVKQGGGQVGHQGVGSWGGVAEHHLDSASDGAGGQGAAVADEERAPKPRSGDLQAVAGARADVDGEVQGGTRFENLVVAVNKMVGVGALQSASGFGCNGVSAMCLGPFHLRLLVWRRCRIIQC